MTPATRAQPVVPDVSVVIVHVGYPRLRDCLDTLFASVERLVIEAVVVDNCSGTADLSELVAKYPAAKLVRLDKRVGYSRATNHGIRASAGRHILWCNDDVLFEHDAVDRLVAFLDAHADYGAAGPRVLNPDRSFQPCFSLVHISLFNLIIERLNIGTLLPRGWSTARTWIGHEDKEQDVAVGCGACMLIRRAAMESIGGALDERFFMYAEEFDLSYRLQTAGWRIRYIPSATVIHVGSQSTISPAAKVPTHFRWIVQSWRSRFAYLRKHSGHTAEGAYAVVFVATAVPRWLITETLALIARLRGNRNVAANYRARARLHLFSARMALRSDRHDAGDYPPYPA